MIEIHSHILPGIDDGAQSKDESLEMAIHAVEQGITDIIATPHHGDGTFETPPNIVRRNVEALNEWYSRHSLPIKVHAGQEIRIHADLLDEWEKQQLLTLAGSRYILIELPPSHVPSYLNDMIHELRVRGLVPVIAHPERNKEAIASPSLMSSWIEQGALCQLTSHSLTGYFGRKIQKLSLQLCKSSMIHFVSSDAHHNQQRNFALEAAFRIIERSIGKDVVGRYIEYGARLLQNEEIVIDSPGKVRRKLFW
ncbi:tyrosine protein phosphatase [Paenibacillus rhizovicinus]|uniref:Tyrosine-protein phosphatase n=1 Tax=Paenibacillus rhizovicinus TaxID=2704463 RepID=A0A6C0NXF5_9BACL|nr:CpsB/CapC family capsule biosynthesis tyrosine phosphatase [Paenibacillus rhizovicinus]QHW30868.1 tyrosine protein phosphatase [Paenibacillus rhizovicinus]